MTRFSGKSIIRRRIGVSVALVLLLTVVWCMFSPLSRNRSKARRPHVASRDPSLVLVTGYCNCGKCCGWKKSWFGFGGPVYNYGPNKGKPKQIGVTASGIVASHGTVAADPKVFPMGTKLSIPGYGIGRVEDTGGAIKGRHIDVWFSTHEEALKWGARWIKVEKVKDEV
jgi:3D (Asp-Asp-Asp) domain-containing protein